VGRQARVARQSASPFTLVDVICAIAVFVSLATMSVPVFQNVGLR
jgi:Tfp pilus assembly major pilin PilA